MGSKNGATMAVRKTPAQTYSTMREVLACRHGIVGLAWIEFPSPCPYPGPQQKHSFYFGSVPTREAGLMRSLRVVIFVLVVAACGPAVPGGGPPAPTRSTLRVVSSETAEFLTEGNRSAATLPVSSTEAWAAIPGVYEQLGIPVTEVSPDMMTLGNPDFRTRRIDGNRMGHYLDCGITNSGVLANIYDVTITISTRVVDAPEGGAVVTTTLDAWARPRMTNGNPVHCSSKQRLEQRLNGLVAEKLGVGGLALSARFSPGP